MLLRSTSVALKLLNGAIEEVQVRNKADSAYRAIKASAFTVSSDARDKREVHELTNAQVRQLVDNVKVRRYRMEDDEPDAPWKIGAVIDADTPVELQSPTAIGPEGRRSASIYPIAALALEHSRRTAKRLETLIQDLKTAGVIT